MIAAGAIFLAVLCVGLLISSFGQGHSQASSRLGNILRDMESAHAAPSMRGAGSQPLPKMLVGSKYNRRKEAEKQLLQVLRFAMLGSMLFFAYTFLLATNAPQLLKTLSVVAILGSIMPVMVMKSVRNNRLSQTELSLINVIDLIAIGLEAGMTLPAVIREIVLLEPNKKDPLRIELEQMIAELDAGLDLNKALQGLASRCEIEELRILASAVVQAERVGSGLAQTFRIYGEDLRSTRREKIRAKIQKLPVKMLIPMVVFQLMPLLGLILGPIAIKTTAAFSQ